MTRYKYYNYIRLAQEMIKLFQTHPRADRVGLPSWWIMEQLGIGSYPTFQKVKKAANDLLRQDGQVIQYDPGYGTFFLAANGRAAKGLRLHQRYLFTRLKTYRNDAIAARNGYPKGSPEWVMYNNVALTVRHALEFLNNHPEN